MLKIKDGIDLKELEKFGFIHYYFNGIGYYHKEIDDKNYPIPLQIFIFDELRDDFKSILKERYISTDFWTNKLFKRKHIQDLIRAGLVEEVG